MSQWDKYANVEAALESLPKELRDLLGRHEAARLASDWLTATNPLESMRDHEGEAVFSWDVVGLVFQWSQPPRLFEAISIFSELYHRMCEAQEGADRIHKGLPLIRLRDLHRLLGHPWHEERYLLLTLVEDAISDQGKINLSQTGIYHRFRWEDGRADKEFWDLAKKFWESYSMTPQLGEFPEEILRRVNGRVHRTAASQAESDLFEINTVYASRLYQSASQGQWQDLENLAAYELACVPGFDVEKQKQTQASRYDLFVRLRGNYVDFRRELGAYILGECKDLKDPVGPEAIAYLAQCLTFHECAAGILFSWNGITGNDEVKNAALTVLRSYHHSGRIILVLDRDDFHRASQGEPLQDILRQRYEQVRFDLSSAGAKSH